MIVEQILLLLNMQRFGFLGIGRIGLNVKRFQDKSKIPSGDTSFNGCIFCLKDFLGPCVNLIHAQTSENIARINTNRGRGGGRGRGRGGGRGRGRGRGGPPRGGSSRGGRDNY